jgi:alpha-N-arabinofuranosidase
VFEMYAPHQEAVALPVWLEDAPIEWEEKTMPRISASASRTGSGKILLTLCNLHHEEAAELRVELRGFEALKAAGRILTGPDTDSRNNFERPEAVTPAAFDGVAISRGTLVMTLPARSVVALDLT